MFLGTSIHSYPLLFPLLYCGSWKLKSIFISLPFPCTQLSIVHVRRYQKLRPLSSSMLRQMNGLQSGRLCRIPQVPLPITSLRTKGCWDSHYNFLSDNSNTERNVSAVPARQWKIVIQKAYGCVYSSSL